MASHAPQAGELDRLAVEIAKMQQYSCSGTVKDAIKLQAASGVQDRFRGAWFHVSQNDSICRFDNQHEDWTFFSRSPLGGAIWGKVVIQVYLIAPATKSRVETAGKGDPLGWEGERSLPDWWLFVDKEDIDKLMVVRKYHLLNDEDVAVSIRDGAEFQAVRQAAVAKLSPLEPRAGGALVSKNTANQSMQQVRLIGFASCSSLVVGLPSLAVR